MVTVTYQAAGERYAEVGFWIVFAAQEIRHFAVDVVRIDALYAGAWRTAHDEAVDGTRGDERHRLAGGRR